MVPSIDHGPAHCPRSLRRGIEPLRPNCAILASITFWRQMENICTLYSRFGCPVTRWTRQHPSMVSRSRISSTFYGTEAPSLVVDLIHSNPPVEMIVPFKPKSIARRSGADAGGRGALGKDAGGVVVDPLAAADGLSTCGESLFARCDGSASPDRAGTLAAILML